MLNGVLVQKDRLFILTLKQILEKKFCVSPKSLSSMFTEGTTATAIVSADRGQKRVGGSSFDGTSTKEVVQTTKKQGTESGKRALSSSCTVTQPCPSSHVTSLPKKTARSAPRAANKWRCTPPRKMLCTKVIRQPSDLQSEYDCHSFPIHFQLTLCTRLFPVILLFKCIRNRQRFIWTGSSAHYA